MKTKEELLITIILYLLLSFTFFNVFINEVTGGGVDNRIILIFMFGILAIACLYIGYHNKILNWIKAFGYVFSGTFILLFGWFLFVYYKRKLSIWEGFIDIFRNTSVWWALLIPLIILMICLIIKTIQPIRENKIKQLIKEELKNKK